MPGTIKSCNIQKISFKNIFDKVVQKLNANYEDNWDVIPNYFVDQDPYEWRNLKKVI